MSDAILGFFNAYRFLSNFHLCTVMYGNIMYISAEHAYQARKARNKIDHDAIKNAPTPGKAKRIANRVDRSPNFDATKLLVMEGVLRAKFTQDQDLKEKLLATKERHLEEANCWNDRFWGTCEGEGENHLGKLLMKIRDELKVVLLEKGKRYNFKGQSERLVYLGKNWSGNGYWHQFAKVESIGVVWAELLDSDLTMIEETLKE